MGPNTLQRKVEHQKFGKLPIRGSDEAYTVGPIRKWAFSEVFF